MTVLLEAPPSFTDPDFALLPDGRRVTRLEDIIRARAAASPDATALVTPTGTQTFAELDAASSRVGQALVGSGVGPGDRVAWIGPNQAAFLEVLYGTAKMGGVLTSVNVRLAEDELAFILGDADPTLVVLGSGFSHLAELVRRTTTASIVSLDPLPGAGTGTSTVVASYDAWIGAASDRDPGHARDPRACALMLYSSGTTGRPKGIELCGEAVGRGLAGMHYLIGFDTTSVAHAPLPFFHISGIALAMAATLDGAALLMITQTSTADLCRLMQEHRVSHTVLVPTVVGDLLRLPGVRDLDWSALRYITYGGAAMPEPVLREALEVFECDFLQSYGLTESTGGVTLLTAEDHRDETNRHRLASVGRPMPRTPLRVIDPETLADVEPGTPGEIVVGGPRVMLGYWRNDPATAEAVDADGWLRTGDGGWIDSDGYVFLRDRIKDMVVSGGENIYPAEVERVLLDHPALAEVAVVGVPSARWGESPIAVVVPAGPEAVSEEQVIAWARERLAHYKCPVRVVAVEALPRNASGKVLKHVLRREYAGV
jgi:acyl-CoA synthetase (AMP-forming)/AMP-acid ligase II